MTYHWADFVTAQTAQHGPIVVGIDPVMEDLPQAFDSGHDWLAGYVEFLLAAIDGHVGFVKFQSAFFEAYGSAGVAVLAKAIADARARGIGIIMDAKRGDIGSTAGAYARAYLTPGASDLEANCLTINPFLGPDSLEPFVDCARRYGKGLFILAKTSNPGATWLQDERIGQQTVSEKTALLINDYAMTTKGDNGLSSVGAVIGATVSSGHQTFRTLMPDSIFLVPGLGAQGGSVDHIKAMARPDGSGFLVPVSRGIAQAKDRGMTKDDYGQMVQKRIAEFSASFR